MTYLEQFLSSPDQPTASRQFVQRTEQKILTLFELRTKQTTSHVQQFHLRFIAYTAGIVLAAFILFISVPLHNGSPQKPLDSITFSLAEL